MNTLRSMALANDVNYGNRTLVQSALARAQAALAEARRQYQQALDDEREDAMQRAQEIIERRRR